MLECTRQREARARAISLISQSADECIKPPYPVVYEKEYAELAKAIKRLLEDRTTIDSLGRKILYLCGNKPDFNRNMVSAQASLLRYIKEIAGMMLYKDFSTIFTAMDEHCRHEPCGWFQVSTD